MKAAEGGLTGSKGYENMNYVHLGYLLAGLIDKPKVEASVAQHGCGTGTKAYGEIMDLYGDRVLDMLADLERGRFVSRATVRSMKDGELGFDDLTSNGGPSNGFIDPAAPGLGLADKKNGGCGSDNGRGCGSQLVMLPGDVQIVALFNSRSPPTAGRARPASCDSSRRAARSRRRRPARRTRARRSPRCR